MNVLNWIGPGGLGLIWIGLIVLAARNPRVLGAVAVAILFASIAAACIASIVLPLIYLT